MVLLMAGRGQGSLKDGFCTLLDIRENHDRDQRPQEFFFLGVKFCDRKQIVRGTDFQLLPKSFGLADEFELGFME